MENILLDFQGFNVSGKFYFKEVSFTKINTNVCQTYWFKPPFPFCALTSKDKKTVTYCERHLHNIKWYSGKILYKRLLAILRNHIRNNDRVFVKGHSKVEVMQKLFPNVLFENIEDYSCPPVQCIINSADTDCPLPFHQNHLHCSHHRSILFAMFMTEHFKNE